MRKFMIRKPNIYEGMRDASFLPGVGLTLLIAMLLYAAYYLLREIPANIIDILYYSQQHVKNQLEAAKVIKEYLSLPGTMIAELLLTSVLMALTLLYVRRIEKRPVKTLGLVRKGALGGFSRGYFAGLALFIIAAVAQMLLRTAEYTGFKTVSILFAFAFIVQALSEETAFRGFLLSTLTKKAGLLPAIAISSALYSLMHISNYGFEPLVLAELFVRGVLFALIVLRTGSLWGAIGMHAAWNFAFSQVSPLISGDLVTNVSAFRFGPAALNAFADASVFLFIAAEAGAIAFVLLAGKNRLVVPLSEEKNMYYKAMECAKTALKDMYAEDGTPLIKRALSAARSAEEDAVKTAVLLYLSGTDTDGAGGFSEEVREAVGALRSGIASRINSNAAAHAAAHAIRKCKYAHSQKRLKNVNKTEHIEVFCPLLRREIEPLYCSTVMQAVDSGASDMKQLNINLCKMCAVRDPGANVSQG